MPTGPHTENEFLATLGHALRFLELIESTTSVADKQTFATASTFFCAASVEAAANGVLQLVDVSKKVTELIDRFPVVEKFDLVASARGKTIDRGGKAVQGIRELIQNRNGIVHPKIVTQNVEFETFPGDEHFARRHIAVDAVTLDGSAELSAAIKSSRATIDFLDYALADLLGLTQDEAEHCLVGVGPTKERRPAYHMDSLRILLRYQERFGRFRFIKLPIIPGETAS